MPRHSLRRQKQKRPECLRPNEGKRKEALPSLSDTEWSTYDVILLSSRLGVRSNPLANWKHAILYYLVVGDPEAIGASFRGD
jgi:hypothetical protein